MATDRPHGHVPGKEGGKTRPLPLTAKTELFDQRPVPIHVLGLQVIEQTATLADHLVKSTPGVMILFVDLQVPGKLVDPLCQDSDLNLGRSRVVFMQLKLLDDRLLGIALQSHLQSPPCSPKASA